MGIFDGWKKKKETDSSVLDDLSYIADVHHVQGPWNQYDFLLASQGYGWDYMVDTADYMTKADLDQIGTVSVTAAPGGSETERIEEYKAAKDSVKAMKSLSEEASALGIGGISKTIGAPVKIVWFNQTRVIRIFSPVDDEDLFRRYMETVIRRTFGTPDAMKAAKPVK